MPDVGNIVPEVGGWFAFVLLLIREIQKNSPEKRIDRRLEEIDRRLEEIEQRLDSLERRG